MSGLRCALRDGNDHLYSRQQECAMDTPIHFDPVPIAADELAVSDFENALIALLVKFARAIRDHRHNPGAIRQTVLSFIFAMTPADYAAILPIAGNEVQFE